MEITNMFPESTCRGEPLRKMMAAAPDSNPTIPALMCRTNIGSRIAYSFVKTRSHNESKRPSRTSQPSGGEEESCREDEADPHSWLGQKSTVRVHSGIEHAARHLTAGSVSTAGYAVLQEVREIGAAECDFFEDSNRKRRQDCPEKWSAPRPRRKQQQPGIQRCIPDHVHCHQVVEQHPQRVKWLQY